MINSAILVPVLRFLNLGGAIGLLSSLIVTLVLQFTFFDLPCPLCLLQRVGFFGMTLGFMLNLRFGFKPAHYAMVLISALFTGMIALRQIALHVVPGTGSYGMAIFDLHLYTWSFILSAAALVATTLMLGFNQQYQINTEPANGFRRSVNVMFVLFLTIIFINIVAAFLLCGFQACASDPLYYQLLH